MANTRRTSYFLLHRLLRTKLLSDIEDVKNYYSDKLGNDLEHQHRIKNLLSHAKISCSFYLNRPYEELNDFPVINKAIIRDNLSEFLSSNYAKSKLRKVVTSGSTGTPFEVYHDRRKRIRNTADAIFFGSIANYNIGEKLYYFKIWNNINRKNKLLQFIQNFVCIDVVNLDDDTLSDIFNLLIKDKSQKSILSYASAMEMFARYLDSNSISSYDLNLRSIICMSESLNDYTKKTLKKYTNILPVSRYSNVENGIIAQENNSRDMGFFINWASYHVELLDINNDKPVSLGRIGRIVITDLFNYGMPMIRYDTGDLGIMGIDSQGRKYFKSIEGRRMDLIRDTQSRIVSSFVITNNMWLYPEIKQYQFIQESKTNYKFKLNMGAEPFNREEELVEQFKQYFGHNATIKIEYVDEIPLLSSGKRKKVVNLIE